jgi:hypothetical protein
MAVLCIITFLVGYWLGKRDGREEQQFEENVAEVSKFIDEHKNK